NHLPPAFAPTSYANAALYVAQDGSAEVAHVLFANNLHDSNAGISGGINLPAGSVTITGALNAPDAGFVSAGSPNEDYHLGGSSPAIDQAIASTLSGGPDGTTRPGGAGPDRGARGITAEA